MTPTIDRVKTGARLRALLRARRLSVQSVRATLRLSSVQSVYYWMSGQRMPSVENLYALSCLLGVPLDDMIVGTRVCPRALVRLEAYASELARIYAGAGVSITRH